MAEKKGSSSEKTLYCSFCGKSQHEVKKLIAGPSVFVCDECIDLCNEIIRDELPAGDESKEARSDLPTPAEIKATLERALATHRAGAAIEPPRDTGTDNVRELAMARRAEAAAAAPKRAEAVRQSPASRATRVLTPPTPTAIVELSARRRVRTAWWTAGVLGTALAAIAAS